MPEIEITAAGAHVYEATVTDGDATTRHEIRVGEDFLARLGLAESQEPLLVRASVRYLLERQEPAAIPESFGLHEIERTLPDYPHDIGTQL